jgi:hypothetical protein
MSVIKLATKQTNVWQLIRASRASAHGLLMHLHMRHYGKLQSHALIPIIAYMFIVQLNEEADMPAGSEAARTNVIVEAGSAPQPLAWLPSWSWEWPPSWLALPLPWVWWSSLLLP